MHKTILLKTLLLSVVLCSSRSYARSNEYARLFAEPQSLTWEQLPYQWNEGAFLGNGIVGLVAYVDSTDNSLTLHLCRPDVTDHRKAPNKKTSMGVKGADVMFDFCRLDIGKFKLYPQSPIIGGKFKQNIYRGVVTGTLQTKKGNIDFTIFTPYQQEVNVLRYTTSLPVKCAFIPGNPQSPRTQVFAWTKKQQNYIDNPLPSLRQTRNEGLCIQGLLAGGDYATFWKQTGGKGCFTAYISTANEVPQAGLSQIQAKKNVTTAMAIGYKKLLYANGQWWNNYQGGSFISIPDKKLENFYAIQMYKLATCSNPKGPAMDNFGTFFKMSQWPGMWWNLNVQLTYQSVYPNNRMDQGINFQRLIDNSFFDIISNIPVQKAGDYGWALHNYYLYLRYNGADNNEYVTSLCPKIKALLQLYEPQLKEDDGKLMLAGMESPEYEGFKTYNNSNYNLAVLRWLIQTLVKYGKDDDKDVIKWKGIVDRLPSPPTDDNGMMIAENVPLNKSHRHYSHLLGFYPLHIMDVDNPETKEFLEKSIAHWLTIGEGKGLAGYSYTGSSSLYALLGNGEKAYRQLAHFINEPIGISLLLPNTLYVESDGKNPVIETPLSASTALAEMMIQSWGDKIRIFPAIPDSWSTCCFRNLRAEGAFEVSAQRQDGKTSWVKIHSCKGKPCIVSIKDWKSAYAANATAGIIVTPRGNGLFEVNLKAGESVTLTETQQYHDTAFHYALPISDATNFYGVKRGHGLPYRMDWPDVPIK